MCNLYPFVKTVASSDVTVSDAVEQIDIGELDSEIRLAFFIQKEKHNELKNHFLCRWRYTPSCCG